MAGVNKQGYVVRASQGARGQSRSKTAKILRDWWLVKTGTTIKIGIVFPKEYLGKRIRIKIEVVEENKK